MALTDLIEELGSKLTNISDAIKATSGKKDSLSLDEMADEVNLMLNRNTAQNLLNYYAVTITKDDLKNVVSIIPETFKDRVYLEKIEIPSTVTSIDITAFDSCPTLKEIEVDSNNVLYASYQGNLYTKDYSTLIYYPANNFNSEFHPNLQYVNKSVFIGRDFSIDDKGLKHYGKILIGPVDTNITHIILDDSYICIAEDAFTECNKLVIYTPLNTKLRTWHDGWNCGRPIVWNYEANDVAADGYTYINIDGINYAIINDTEVKVTGNNVGGNVVIPETVKYDNKIYTVVRIDFAAFKNCNSLESITLPFVGDGRVNTNFGYIFGSQNYQENSNYIPTSLQTVIITGGTSIDEKAFTGCSFIKHITIPNTITEFGFGVFQDCISLESLTLPFIKNADGDTHIGYLFGTNSYVSNSDYVPSSLKTVVITDSSSIGKNTFDGCSSLINILIPDSITCIEESTFAGCTSLTNIIIPNNTTSIGRWAFNGCISLTNITIPDSVTSIGYDAFRGCTAKIKWGDNPLITTIEQFAFDGYAGTHITIPNSVINIDYMAFGRCPYLSSVTIGEGVTNIGKWAFYDCGSLVRIVVDENNLNYQSIDGNLYSKDGQTLIQYAIGKNDTSFVIPDSVTSIGDHAFSYCTSLLNITIPNNIIIIGEFAFSDCNNLTIYCEVASKPSDWSSNWDSGCTVIWDCNNNNVANDGYIYGINIDGINYAIKDNEAKVVSTNIEGNVIIPDFISYNGNNYNITNIYWRAFYDCRSLTSITIPDSVTSIGHEVFRDCRSLTNITIPDSVTSIGSGAFRDCRSLTNITIPDSVTSIGSDALNGCSSLESITLPFVGSKAGVTSSDIYQYPLGYIFGTSTYTGGVKTTQSYHDLGPNNITSNTYYIPSSLKSVTITGGNILYGAFSNCNLIENIIIKENITSIAEAAFSGCSHLKEITLPFVGNRAGVTAGDTYQYPFGYIFGTGSYSNAYSASQNYYDLSTDNTATSTYYIPFSLKKVTITDGNILYGAFSDCEIENITIGDGVTSIGDYAFDKCYFLTDINISNSVTHIGQRAFLSCMRLVNIIIGNGVTSIGDEAFSGCKSLTSIDIPKSVTSIGENIFSGCSSLTNINCYADTIDGWAERGFGKQLDFGYNLYIDKELLTEVKFIKTTDIPNYIFYNCISITNVIIPNGVTSIGNCAFYGCKSLTNITIPYGVTHIYAGAFWDCTSLTSITIPDSVTKIQNDAFTNCDSLTIYCEAASKPSGWSSSWNKTSCPVVWDCQNSDTLTHNGCLRINDIEYKYNFSNKTATVTRILSQYVNSIDILTTFTYNRREYMVTSIAQGVLKDCRYIENLTIPFIGANLDGTGATHFGYIFGADNRYSNQDYVPPSLKTVIINGGDKIDDGAFYNCSSLRSVKMNNVKDIGILAFYGCNNLEYVEIPSSIESINIAAFYDCSKLVYTTKNNLKYLGDTENPYIYCEGATNRLTNTKAEIEEGCKIIGAGAFLGGVLLSSVTIPSTVTTIGEYAFRSCSILKTVNFADNSQLKFIGKEAFRDCKGTFLGGGITSLTIPNSVEVIGKGILRGCEKLASLSIPFIGKTRAYNDRYCYLAYIFGKDSYGSEGYVPTTLKTVKITDAEYIGDLAFYNCSNIRNIYLNCVDKLIHVGDGAFDKCTSLIYHTSNNLKYLGTEDYINKHFYCAGKTSEDVTSATIESTCKIIGYDALNSITVTIPDSVISLGLNDVSSQYTTDDNGLQYYGTKSNPYLRLKSYQPTTITSASIHKDCKYIDKKAFHNCTTLKSITFNGNNVKEIGESAFYNCNGLTTITLPESVEIIKHGAFYECNNLNNIDLSKTNIIKLPDELFGVCGNVNNLKLNDKIETIGSNVFDFTFTGTDLTIPKSVTSISSNAFKNFKTNYTKGKIRKIHYTGTIDDWATIEFGNPYSTPLRYAIDDNIGLYIDGQLVENIVLDKAYKISDYAFCDYRKIKSVVISDIVTSIGSSAFENCFNLTKLDISNNAFYNIASAIELAGFNISDLGITLDEDISKIKGYAFYNTGLTEITIPAGTKSIGKKAFNYTDASDATIKTVDIKATVPPILTDETEEIHTFPSSVTKFTVPLGVYSIYQNNTDGWENYKNKITRNFN